MTKMMVFVGAMIVLMLGGCADQVSFAQAAEVEPVGFLHGFWHGMILPISFIVSLFSDQCSIYAIYNNGGWYDFGYLLGLGVLSFEIKFRG